MSDNLDNIKSAMSEFSKSLNKGKEPMREFRELDNSDVDAWSKIPREVQMCIIEMELISDEFNIPIIRDKMVIPYYRNSLSVDGYARTQLENAHKSVRDNLSPQFSGQIDNSNNPLENQKGVR